MAGLIENGEFNSGLVVTTGEKEVDLLKFVLPSFKKNYLLEYKEDF